MPEREAAVVQPAALEGRPRPPLTRVSTSCHDEYLRAFRPLRLEGFLLERAGPSWSVARCRLRSVVVEHGVDAAPWAATARVDEGTVALAVSGSPDGDFRVDGHDAARDVVLLPPAGARATLVARQKGDWYAFVVPETRLPGLAAVRGSTGEASVPGLFRAAELARLRALAARAVSPASASGPPPEALEALEADLVAAIAAGLGGREEGAPRGTVSRVPRHEVLEKIEALLEARTSEPVYVADLCAAAGLPERTLRYVLSEQYGTSPVRLLRNRRLCQLRRSLLSAPEPSESLARLARRHGFWHMGTLAADYRRLFGELPSETRQAAAEGAERRAGMTGPVLVRPAADGPGGRPAAVARSVAGR